MTEKRGELMPRPRGTGSVYLQQGSAVWWIKYYRNGRPYRESSRTVERGKAVNFLKKRLAEVTTGDFCGPQAERIRVSELAEEMLRDYRVNGRKSYQLTDQRWKNHLLPFFGQLRAVDVTTDLINRYIEKRRESGTQNGTINRDLAALKRAFYLGYRSSPRKVYQVPVFPRLKENAPRKGFVRDAQYKTLCANCKEPWMRAMLAVAYSFGFRKGELLHMRTRQIDLLNRTITLDPGTTKNGDGRTIKMTREVYAALLECVRGKAPDDLLFTRKNGKPVLDFRGAWYSLCQRSGLGQLTKTEDGREKWEGLIFHDLRRSAVRNMVRRGIPERVSMTISGHKTRAVFDRYNIVSESDLIDAARKIEEGRENEVGHSFGHSDGEDHAIDKAEPLV
jgi:integrase